jgi:SPP1 gp7 family putative phage head morphogenesis protein
VADLTPFGEFQREGYRATEQEIRRLSRAVAEEYRLALDSIGREIQDLYARVLVGVPKENWYNEVIKFGRLQALQRNVQDLYVQASIRAGNTTEAASRVAISNNFYRQQFAIKMASDWVNPFTLSFAQLSHAAIEVSVMGTPSVWREISKRAQERIERQFGPLSRYQPQHGTLTEVLLRNRQDQLAQIRREITQGMVQGRSYAQVSARLRDIMNTSANKAIRVVRTETNRNLNAGHYASSQAARAQGVEVRRMMVAVQDARTRPQSAQMDGDFANEEDLFVYPNGATAPYPGMSGVARYDINDRETVIDVLPDYPPDERRGRDPNCTGPRSECTTVLSYQTFGPWAKSHGLRKNQYGQWVPQD